MPNAAQSHLPDMREEEILQLMESSRRLHDKHDATLRELGAHLRGIGRDLAAGEPRRGRPLTGRHVRLSRPLVSERHADAIEELRREHGSFSAALAFLLDKHLEAAQHVA